MTTELEILKRRFQTYGAFLILGLSVLAPSITALDETNIVCAFRLAAGINTNADGSMSFTNRGCSFQAFPAKAQTFGDKGMLSIERGVLVTSSNISKTLASTGFTICFTLFLNNYDGSPIPDDQYPTNFLFALTKTNVSQVAQWDDFSVTYRNHSDFASGYIRKLLSIYDSDELLFAKTTRHELFHFAVASKSYDVFVNGQHVASKFGDPLVRTGTFNHQNAFRFGRGTFDRIILLNRGELNEEDARELLPRFNCSVTMLHRTGGDFPATRLLVSDVDVYTNFSILRTSDFRTWNELASPVYASGPLSRFVIVERSESGLVVSDQASPSISDRKFFKVHVFPPPLLIP